MLKRGKVLLLLVVLLTMGGCATVPAGPSVMVLPAPDKPFDQFRAEDAVCRQWAAQQIGISPQDTINQNTAAGAVVGTIIGAGLGAAIGSATGDAGTGAAIGAGTGLLFGATSGASAGQVYGWEAQRRYDIAYLQCMYAKGNQIPGMTQRTRRYQRIPPPPPDYEAPPSSYTPYPGSPPPPP